MKKVKKNNYIKPVVDILSGDMAQIICNSVQINREPEVEYDEEESAANPYWNVL